MNIQEGFALIYRLCFRDKDILLKIFRISLVLLTTISFHYFAVMA